MKHLMLTLTLCLAGCSVLMTQPPHTMDPSVPPRCSEAQGNVALDVVFAGVWGLAALVALTGDEPGLGLLGGISAAGHAGSAVHARGSARRCTEAHEAHEAWRATQGSREVQRAEAQGALGTRCYPNGTCNQGLACDGRSQVCVRAPAEQAEAAARAPDEPAGQTGTAVAGAAAPALEDRPGQARGEVEMPDPWPQAPSPAAAPEPAQQARPAPRPGAARPAPAQGVFGDFWREEKR